jgi:hypothetical protein
MATVALHKAKDEMALHYVPAHALILLVEIEGDERARGGGVAIARECSNEHMRPLTVAAIATRDGGGCCGGADGHAACRVCKGAY